MIVGVDEAGRGALAGPVVAAAVWLPADAVTAIAPTDGGVQHVEAGKASREPARESRAGEGGLAGLRDSKQLSAPRREVLARCIRESAGRFAVVAVSAETIDRVNILQATLQAMHQAVAQIVECLPAAVSEVLVDGNQLPDWPWRARAIPGGDRVEPAIMAASILAKVERDRLMQALDARFPGYGLAAHKGYPTLAHRQALLRLGPCAEHRRSYAPVARCLAPAAAAEGVLK